MRPTSRRPATPASREVTIMAMTMYRFVRTPTRRAVSTLAPVADTRRPTGVCSSAYHTATPSTTTYRTTTCTPRTLVEVRLWNPAGTGPTNWFPETSAVTDSRMELVPSVAMKLLIPTHAISRPFTRPTTRHAANVSTTAIVGSKPLFPVIHAMRTAATPNVWAADRSNWPAARLTKRPNARMTVT